jgi:glycosyltransferase involved in cell wall biosynthesis
VISLGLRARAEAIKHVDTEWFIFVDDDIELFNGWFKAISKYILCGLISRFAILSM